MKRLTRVSFVLAAVAATLGFVACGDSETAAGDTCPLTDCEGTCVDTRYDPANCGACGTACGAGEVCSAGSCASSCGNGSTDCSGSCVDTQANANHCGACGTACAADEVCSAGACAASCGGGTTECASACVDTMVDPANCGGCGTTCSASEICTAGSCTSTCPAPNVLCEGKCIDPNTDNNYCGANGACAGLSAGSVCTDGEICDGAGTCGVVCAANLVNCGGICIDPNTDNTYCGASGACMGGTVGSTCGDGQKCNGAGVCTLSCQSGLLDCNGTCIDPDTSETFCGATLDCAGNNAGTVCAADEKCIGNGQCATTFDTHNLGGHTEYPLDPDSCGCCGAVTTAETATALCVLGGKTTALSWTLGNVTGNNCYCWDCTTPDAWASNCCGGSSSRPFILTVTCQ